MSVYVAVCLSYHMVSVINFSAHSPELVEEGEGGFGEEELWLGQVFPLGKLGKEVLKQHCFLGRPCCAKSIAVQTNGHTNATPIHYVNVLEISNRLHWDKTKESTSKNPSGGPSGDPVSQPCPVSNAR